MRSINLLLAFLLVSAVPAIAQEPFVVLEYRSGNSAAGGASSHRVRRGETLAMIVAKYYGRSAVGHEVGGEKRTVMKFHPRVAPIKASVFPLVKNKPELVEKAQSLYQRLQRKWNVMYDQSGAIGRRYRRADEAGVPYALTVDFDTLEGDGSITLRDRDSTKQERLSEDEAVAYLEEKINP